MTLSYQQAEAWATAHGLAIDLSIHRSATHPTAFDIESTFIAVVRDLQRQLDLTCETASDLPVVPPAHVASTRRALAAEIREVVEKMERLRGGLVSLAAHGEARVVWEAQQNLCSVAGRMTE